MALLSRRGNKNKYDKNKLRPGEHALVLDDGALYFCYGAGNVKKLQTQEDLVEVLNSSAEAYSALLQCVADLNNNPSELTNILSNISGLGSELASTVKQGAAGSITHAMLTQEVREELTGGSVAVVGVDAVLPENIVMGAVTENKTNFLQTTNLNIFNKSNILTGKSISSTDHKTIIDLVGVNVSDDYIKIDFSKTYVCLNVSGVNIYDVNKNYLNQASNITINSAVGSVLAVSPNISNYYIRVAVSDDKLNSCVVTEKTEDISSLDYFICGDKETKFPYFTRIIDGTKEIMKSSIGFDKTTFIGIGKNRFDSSKSTVGYYINTNTGILAASVTYNTSDYISIEAGKSYTISPRFRQFLLYNKRQKPMTATFINAATSNYSFTAIVDGYVRFSYYASEQATVQLEEGSAPTSYEKYTVKFTNDIQMTPNMISQNNVLAGKKVMNFGDSIAAGDGNSGVGYAELIATKNGMTCYDKAVGGATVRVVSGSTNNILNQINNATETDPDFVLMDGLTNDATTDVITNYLGSISSGYVATLDTATFCGAFETILKTVKTKWIGKKILYVCVHKMPSRDTNAQETLQSLARQMCQKWSVPYVDLYNEGGLNTYIAAMLSAYADAGGTHPNYDGYGISYVPMIEGKMKII